MDAVKILGSLLQKNALGSKTGGNILESLLGGATTPRGKAPSSVGAPGDILSTLLGGKKGGGKSGLAALGALLAVAMASRGNNAGAGKGSDGGLLGSLLGGEGGKGGLGDLIGGMMGGGGARGGWGDMLGSVLGAGGGSAPGIAPTPISPPPLQDDEEAQEGAKLLIEAMCLAARADGRVDEAEREAILGKLGDLDPDEAAFVKEQLAAQVPVEDFARRVPEDMGEQVYAFSLMAVKLDSRSEAEFFARLAPLLGLSGAEANDIHERLGQPEIFA